MVVAVVMAVDMSWAIGKAARGEEEQTRFLLPVENAVVCEEGETERGRCEEVRVELGERSVVNASRGDFLPLPSFSLSTIFKPP